MLKLRSQGVVIATVEHWAVQCRGRTLDDTASPMCILTFLQLERIRPPCRAGVKQYNGSLDCAKKLTASEGYGALFKGLPPALVRQSTYGSLRYGLYAPIKNSMGEYSALDFAI